MKPGIELSVFIASPGDVMGEREIAREVCEDLSKNPMLSENYRVSFQAIGWEDAFPGAGRSGRRLLVWLP